MRLNKVEVLIPFFIHPLICFILFFVFFWSLVITEYYVQNYFRSFFNIIGTASDKPAVGKKSKLGKFELVLSLSEICC